MAKKSNKGLNVEKVEKVLANATEEVSDSQRLLDKIEKLEKHDEVQAKAEEINAENIQNLLEEDDNMRKILDMNIRGAIKFAEGKSTKGLNGKQYKAITDSYERVLNTSMNEKQINYIKTITDAQAVQVISVINAYQRYTKSLATN